MSTPGTSQFEFKPQSRRAARDPQTIAQLYEKLPPHAVEAEMCLLGSMLIEPEKIGDVIMIVRTGDDFHKPANGAIFETMVDLYDRTGSLDTVQLQTALLDRGQWENVGGEAYLIELAESVPSAANAVHYARLVREKATVRRLIEAAGEILAEAHENPGDSRALLDMAEQRIFRIAEQTEQLDVEKLAELIEQTIKNIEASEGNPITGVATGFHELDEITGGLQRGEMIIIAARPSMGKTALALNLAEQMAVRGQGVGIFSLEMSKQQVVQRLLAARSELDLGLLRRGLGSKHYSRLYAACSELKDAPIYIDDTPGLSLRQLRAKGRRMVGRYEVKCLFVDYLQLLTVGGRVESRQMEVSEISRGIKAMARELNVPIVCLSQLNRSPEQREGHRPRMSDLRESGSIEQDADVVAMLHREEYYHQGEPDWPDLNRDKVGLAELLITKQRNGPTGTVRMTWVAESTRFKDYSPRQESGYVVSPPPRPGFQPRSLAAPNRPTRVDSPRVNDAGGDDDLPI